jgi:hypothetical protein
VDPDPHFSENLVALGIEPEISGSVARNSDHSTTKNYCSGKAKYLYMINIRKCEKHQRQQKM